jgi:hypothetical protein
MKIFGFRPGSLDSNSPSQVTHSRIKPCFNHWVAPVWLMFAVALTACGGGDSPTPPSNNAQLNDLDISISQLDQAFQSSQLGYTASVDYLASSIQVTATTADAKASLTINGVSTASGTPGNPVVLVEGVNALTVTVTAEDGTSSQTYSLAVTRQSLATFAERVYAKASNTGAGDQFGISVSLSGDSLAVGAIHEDSATTGVNSTPDEGASFAGAAYVFTRDSNGLWSEQAYIKSSNIGLNDLFGISVSLSGDTLAVGAKFEGSATTGVNSTPDEGAAGSGAVYVFTRDSNGLWSEQAYIKASNTGAGDQFGISVALSRDSLAVGAIGEGSATTGVNSTPDELANFAGAVYVFR